MLRARQPNVQRKPLTRQRSLPSLHEGTREPQGPTVASDEAIQKISALETELAKLRAQIAQIVLAQEKSAQSGIYLTVLKIKFFTPVWSLSCVVPLLW